MKFRTSIYLEQYLPLRFLRGRTRIFQNTPSTLGQAGLDHLRLFMGAWRKVRRINIRHDYPELQRLNRIPAEQMSGSEWQLAEKLALRVDTFTESYDNLNDSFFAAVATVFAYEELDRSQILHELQGEPWFVKHEVLARWGWLRAHQLLITEGVPLEKPFSFNVARRGQHGRRTDREFYQLIRFLYGLRAHTGEELLFVGKGETPDFELETSSGSPEGAEMTEAPVSREWAAERDAEEEFLATGREVLGESRIHLHVFEPLSWRTLESRLPEVDTWLREELRLWEMSQHSNRLHSENLGLSVSASPWPHPAITVSDERGLTGDDIDVGTLQLEESIALGISGKLLKPNGTPRARPQIRPCHLVIYPNHDFGQDLHTAVQRFHTRPPIDVSSHFDHVWLSDDRCIVQLI